MLKLRSSTAVVAANRVNMETKDMIDTGIYIYTFNISVRISNLDNTVKWGKQ